MSTPALGPGQLNSQERGPRGRELHLTPGPSPDWLYFTHKSQRLVGKVLPVWRGEKNICAKPTT